MASHGVNKPSRDHQIMLTTAKHLRRPSSSMLLKDYLRDDLSSCSSSGFKSFPRRQCGTAPVRFDLLEKDLHAKRSRLLRPSKISHRSSCSFKVASSTISALHKASRAVINAVKLLPFPSISVTQSSSSSSYRKSNSMKRLLSKSLSRKMLSRSFWRKAIEEEENEPPRWKSFREFLEEKEKPSTDQHTQSSSVISVTLGSSSTSGSSSGKSNGNSWGSSSELTWEMLRSTSDNSDDGGVVGGENTVAVQKTATTKTSTEDSSSTTDGRTTLEKIMDWGREEKEQLSPVSVLNGPFGDDEETNSPLDSTRCCSLEAETIPAGSKNKQTKKKSGHFDDVASSLEPVELEKRIAAFSEAKNERRKGGDGDDEEEEEKEEKAWKLVKELEKTSRLNGAEKKLLWDLLNSNSNTEKEEEVSKMAKEWISGEWWEGGENNNVSWEVCVREMDKFERWTKSSDEQVGIQLEFEVLTSLMNELLLELTSSSHS